MMHGTTNIKFNLMSIYLGYTPVAATLLTLKKGPSTVTAVMIKELKGRKSILCPTEQLYWYVCVCVCISYDCIKYKTTRNKNLRYML